jgi:hypothetical protein
MPFDEAQELDDPGPYRHILEGEIVAPSEPRKNFRQLPPKHEMFARALAKGASQAEAHREAGYSGHTGNASKLARDPRIIERVAELQAEQYDIEKRAAELAAKHIAISKERVLEELAKIAFHPIDKDAPISWGDKLSALDKLARYFCMFRTPVDVAGNLSIQVKDEANALDVLISRMARIAARGGSNDNPQEPDAATG